MECADATGARDTGGAGDLAGRALGLVRRGRDGARDLLAPGFRAAPYWHEDLPALPPLADAPRSTVDVLVIGSGYTGLHAAIETARAGRTTLVLEAGEPGQGCSTRNGGQISTSIKPSLEALSRRYGDLHARAIRAEGTASLEWTAGFIQREGLDCGFRRSGRFHAAHTPDHYESIARAADRLSREEGVEAHAVSRAEQASELGTSFYCGGVVYPAHCHVHPARYHRALLETALAAGAEVVPHCPATALQRADAGGGPRFEVATPQGVVRARDVVVATNGYTTALTPWLQRRVIPIGSYVIATEALGRARVARAFPARRVTSDTRRVVYYYGPSPDGERVIFGGRVSVGEADPRVSAPRLHAEMARIFPDLADARISHAWSGFVAYTFDTLAHCGSDAGLHYACGYCGSGVAMASYLGMRAGQRVLDRPEGRTAFDGLRFPTRPLYAGRPWFLPAAVAWYRWRDRLEVALEARRRRA